MLRKLNFHHKKIPFFLKILFSKLKKNQPKKGKQETWKSWVGKKNEVNKTWNRFMLEKKNYPKKKNILK
jgi:hypothetical protein